MKKLHFIVIIASVFLLQACVHKVVTVPAKIAYKTTKGVVKGTVAVGKAIIPGDSDDDDKKDKKINIIDLDIEVLKYLNTQE